MRYFRQTALLGFCGLLITGVVLHRALVNPVEAQQPQPPFKEDPRDAGNGAKYSSVKIIEDPNWRKVINVGRDCVLDKEWAKAVQALQAVLNEKQDHYVQITEVDAGGRRGVPRWTSVKFEANNLIGSMPLEGLAQYEADYGADAKTALDEAKKKGDREMVAEVAQKYCHTKAGIEANEIMATLFLQRGQVFTAALRFEKLLAMNPERTRVSDLTLFKAAIAFHRAGDTKNFDETWKRLEASLAGKQIKVGDESYPLAKLQEVINEGSFVAIVNIHDWPSWRGNDKNSAQANGSAPWLDNVLWKRPIFRDKLDGLAEDPDQPAENRVQGVIRQLETANQPVMPGFFPVISQGVMVYRSQRDIRAIALKNLKIPYEERIEEFKPGQIIWKSMDMDRSLALLLDRPKTRAKAESWLDNYNQVPGFNSLLYDNTVIGTLSTDHRNVYAIDDLAVPPHPNVFHQQAGFNPQFGAGDVKPLLMQNRLLAYDLFSGKLKWELNNDAPGAEDPDFKNSHFLSLPISVGGKLYVLNERLINPGEGGGQDPFGRMTNPIGGESELRLVCIDPTKMNEANRARPTIVDIQVLGSVVQSNRFVQDIGRRVNAAQLAFGEGMLVCPTNAGEVFGIDVMTRSLVWSYPYRENEHQPIMLPGALQPQPFPGKPGVQPRGTSVVSKWKSAPPAIADGKIVFTAPDADSVHCISLRDGRPVWRKAQQKGDLYMAGVYSGRVLIVSETGIRAHDIKDGSLKWSAPTNDLPSGQGVASKNIYYLPLKKGEVMAIDVATGQIKAHNRSAVPGTAPGNLAFYEGMVLTQTVNEIIAYPQLSVRLEAAKVDSANDPANLTKLVDYGELLLKDGQVKVGVDALLKAYNQNPPEPLGKRVKDRLFEGLTDLMHTDFRKTAADHLTTYKALCSVPGNDAEEQSRKAKFYRLVGQGREAEGNLVEAFQMYKDFGALGMHKDKGVPSAEDPNQLIPVNVWLRGRISGMLAHAPAAQKEPLEAKIAEEWKAVEGQKDLDKIRSFVGMFDIPVRVGREARVQLAETIMDRNDRPAFLEAEMSLHQVLGSEFKSDPLTGGRALAALAQLEEKKGTIDSMRLAAVYYRRLGRDFADAKVRGNKTGKDLVNELGTDKRFLAFLEEPTSAWGPVKLAARDIPAGQFQVGMSGFVMLPQGDETPFARQHRIMLDPSDTTNPRIRLRDVAANQDRWMTNLGHVPMNQSIFFHLYQQAGVNQAYHPNARFRFYHVKGHLVVCQVGVMVYCLDGDTGKKLWEMQTVENIANNGLISLQSVTNDYEGNPEFLYWNQLTNQRFSVALGRIGTAQASYVAVLGHKGLSVLDPLRGTVMWKKSDVSINSHVFGDDQYLFLAEANHNGAIGAGRTLRANDGEALNIPDFSNVYQNRVRVVGRQILAAQTSGAGVTLRLYDILTAKDVWSQKFAPGSRVLATEDRNITGILEPNGTLTVLEAETGKQLVSTNIQQGRVAAADIKTLAEPLLLQDSERFYVALNQPVQSGRVSGGMLHNNFNNGTRCLTVNGWFVAIHREAGSKKIGEREINWKKGDLAWHSYNPVKNQMIVLDQFENSPVIVFTTRYNEILPNGGNRWVSVTESYHKGNGKMIYDSGPRNINGFSPTFTVFQTDLKTRTINLIGFSGSVQHYVDDGKGPPPVPGAMLNPLDRQEVTTSEQARILREPVVNGPVKVLPPNFMPLPNPVPADRERILRAIRDLPPIEIPNGK